jgi:dTDP-4-dehydrorhamnose 3,5-epimerase
MEEAMPFQFQQLSIPAVIKIHFDRFGDDRGYFGETYKQSAFRANGIDESFVQDNYSFSRHGVLRGLHYQKHPLAQGKLVRAVFGTVFDVAVDIRHGSPTYGQWVSEILSGENGWMLYVPPGFAHGFCVLSAEAGVAYKVTQEYSPELDRGIIWNDPQIGVRWPLEQPLLSAKDASLPLLKDADNSFEAEP